MTPRVKITIDNESEPCSKESDDVLIITTDTTLSEKLLGEIDVEEDSED